jgi:hypothetical protein
MLSASQEIYSRRVRLVFSEPWKVVRGPVSGMRIAITGQYCSRDILSAWGRCSETGESIIQGRLRASLAAYDVFLVFASTASAAASFRSLCGSVRGAPVCSSQTSPMAAPQVAQSTDSICFGVSSLLFTTTSCNIPSRDNAQYCSFLAHLAKPKLQIVTPVVSCQCEQN